MHTQIKVIGMVEPLKIANKIYPMIIREFKPMKCDKYAPINSPRITCCWENNECIDILIIKYRRVGNNG